MTQPSAFHPLRNFISMNELNSYEHNTPLT
jgi:hypothetical protein